MNEMLSRQIGLKSPSFRSSALVFLVPLLVGSAAWAAPKINVDDSPLNREAKATSFAPVVRKVAPSVVNIYSTKTIRVRPFPFPFFDDPFFRRFFGGDEDSQRRRPLPEKAHSLGSGVIVTEDGYILTNDHVVEGADEVKVALADNKTEYLAKIVGTDSQTGVAVLKINARKLTPITLGDSDKLEVGDVVLAMGNPFQVGQSVTMGIVSAVGRGYGVARLEDWIQTDAAINPGNSGGALVDAEGRLVGINTWIVTGGSGANVGVGFAIPVNLARDVMDHLIKDGKISRGYLGIELQPEDLTPELAKAFKLPDQSGVLVTSVRPNTPAEDAGIKEGDVIVEFNGKKVADNRHLRLIVSQTAPKTKVTLKVIRDGREKILTATLGELPQDLEARAGRPSEPEEVVPSALDGVQVADLDSQVRRQFEIPAEVRGALVTDVDPASPAYDAELRPGDVILEFNHKPVSNAGDARQFIREAKGDEILLRVWSKDIIRFVSVDNPARKK
jgi:serine protease Do